MIKLMELLTKVTQKMQDSKGHILNTVLDLFQ
jgi:hypothetical protein